MENQYISEVEEWRQIPGAPYEASTLGRIRRMLGGRGTRAGKVLTSTPHRGNYLTVQISIGGKPKRYLVHRLVCAAFYGEMPSWATDAAHGDGNRQNNRPSNLRWCTHKQNMDDARGHGTIAAGSRQGHAKLSDDQVKEIRRLVRSGARQVTLVRQYRVTPTTIHNIVHGKTWQCIPMEN